MNTIPAGLGVARELPLHDFETYSEAGYLWDEARNKWTGLPGSPQGKKGLFVIGAPAYAQHPSTEVLSYYFDLLDGHGRTFWAPGLPNPERLFAYVRAGGLIEAQNTGFEWWIWNFVCVVKYGWPPLAIEQTRCSMAKSRANALPGALGLCGQVLGLAVQKDAEGKRLLDKFSVPRNPTKPDPRRRITLLEDHTEHVRMGRPGLSDAQKLYSYNCTDLDAEHAVSMSSPDLVGEELEFWIADQRINRRGVALDLASVEHCIAIIEQAHGRLNAELYGLTGGQVTKASELQALGNWLRAHGVPVTTGQGSMDDEAIESYLKACAPHPPGGVNAARRALEIRAAIGSASVKKVFSMRLRVTPNQRLHDLFNYHAARTGRATGDGPQPTNLPNGGPAIYRCGCGGWVGMARPSCRYCGAPKPEGTKAQEWNPEAMEQCFALLAYRSFDLLCEVYGDGMHALSGCMRGLFIAADGHDLVSSDYSAIEAVVLAVLSGELWRLEVFATHGMIYEASAGKMFGVPIEEFQRVKAETGQHHPLRKKGKTGELAFGYQGWLGAARAFDAPGTDEEVKRDILAWRDANREIVEFWGGQERRQGWHRIPEDYGVEGMAVRAIKDPGVEFPVLRRDGSHTGITYTALTVGGRTTLYCRLPSGRHLTYHNPLLEPSDRNPGTWSISYEGYNTNPKNGPVGWITIRTWGGRLVENIVQAVARDILRHAIVNLERAGYPVVLHVYDEIVSEVPKGWGSIEEFERIMSTMPAWAAGWAVKAAGGWRARRYRKG